MAYSLLSNVMRAIKTKDSSYIDRIADTPEASAIEAVSNVGSEIGTGIKNWWYKNTGRAYLTPDYQHQEMLANTAKQRDAADTMAAGLSKYGGLSGASSPSPSSGNGLLATALQLQNLASGAQDLKERAYNYSVSKGLGIRTNDKNPLAQIAAVFKFLTGKDFSDFGNGEGAVKAFVDWFKGVFNKSPGNSDTGNSDTGNSDISNTTAAAAADGVQSFLKEVPLTGHYGMPRLVTPVKLDPADASKVTAKPDTSSSVQSMVEKLSPNLSYKNASESLMKQLIDKGFNSYQIFLLSNFLSRKYNISENQVLDDLMDIWDKYHGSR